MLPPLIDCPLSGTQPLSRERGFTMALVAVALVSIIAMAALSIDIGTLYQARAEAQRAADAAALAAARVISISGITGDPNGVTHGSWADVCGGQHPFSTLIATNVAQRNLIGGVAVQSNSVTVNYGAGSGASSTDCTAAGKDFAVNPVVTVTVQSASLPIFFARVFSLFPKGNYAGTTVTATASAEVFNPSDSADATSSGKLIPVEPRCVKPWIIPNIDPNGGPFVAPNDGSISNPGILQLGVGVIGEKFNLNADCVPGASDCLPAPPATGNMLDNPPQMNSAAIPPFLEYVPALISGTPGAVPSCSLTTGYQPAIAGCDQSTVYACGTLNGSLANLKENPVNPGGGAGDSSTAVECLINQSGNSGNDTLDTGTVQNPVFPFQIHPGNNNPLTQAGLVSSTDVISSSTSIVTIPIYDSSGAKLVGAQPQVTIVGFLQVFINSVDGAGNINVTVLNVAGCSNDAAGNPTVTGTSPVPVRLITPP